MVIASSGMAAAQQSIVIDDAQATTNGGAALDGDDSITIAGSGSVVTNGPDLYGLSAGSLNPNVAGGDRNTLANNGEIETDGVTSHGILTNNGNYNNLDNNGTIKILGNGHGMFGRNGDWNVLTNGGELETNGEDSHGLFARGDYNTLSNDGGIATLGLNGRGVAARGDDNILINNGDILTTGPGNARGLSAHGERNSVSNSGYVETAGGNAHAVFFQGSDGTITNSGSLLSQNADAIRLNDGASTGNVISLLEGSVLFGDVTFDSPDNTFSFGPGLNAVVQLGGSVPDTIIAPNGAFVVDGDTIHAIDSTGFAASDQRVADLGAQVLAALDRLGPGTAAPEVSQGPAGSEGFAWGGAIGAVGIGGETDTAAGYVSVSGGLVGGYTFDGDTGFFLGLATTHQESDSSFEQDTQNLFGGLHTGFALGGVNVDASLTAGTGSTDQTRTIANNTVVGPVMGIEEAEGAYDTAFVMPAVTFSGDMDRGSDSFTPSVRLRYAKINQDGFDETGTATALLSVEDREAEFFEVRVQVERGLEDKRVGDATMSTRMRMGFDAQVFSGDEVDLVVVAQDLSFGIHDDDVVGRFFVGTDLVRIGDSGSQLTAGFEAGIDTTRRVDVSGGVEWVLTF